MNELISGELWQQSTINLSSKRLVITLKSIVLEEIHQEIRIKRQDLNLYYDKANYMINSITGEEKQAVIKVLSYDADVFVPLC